MRSPARTRGRMVVGVRADPLIMDSATRTRSTPSAALAGNHRSHLVALVRSGARFENGISSNARRPAPHESGGATASPSEII